MSMPGITTESTGADVNFLVSDHKATKGITIASGEGVMVQGQCLGLTTASGKYAKYDDAAADGTQTMVGINAQYVDTTNGDQLSTMVIHGFVTESKLTGIDAAGKVDMAGMIGFY